MPGEFNRFPEAVWKFVFATKAEIVVRSMLVGSELMPNSASASGKSGEAAGNSAKVVDLAQKRSELEKALLATEEAWLALSSQAEAAAG